VQRRDGRVSVLLAMTSMSPADRRNHRLAGVQYSISPFSVSSERTILVFSAPSWHFQSLHFWTPRLGTLMFKTVFASSFPQRFYRFHSKLTGRFNVIG
jgi:hypothetical protein